MSAAIYLAVACLLLALAPAIAAAPPAELEVDLPGGARMAFVWIAPGSFTMGTTEEQKQKLRRYGLWQNRWEHELPAHFVHLTQGFYLARCELTQEQWTAVMGTRPWSGHEYASEDPQCPASYISWLDVHDLIRRLNEAAGDTLYRLPTEAEWEYACRAGTDGYWSVIGADDYVSWSYRDADSPFKEYAWYWYNAWLQPGARHPGPVGTKRPNAWGLYDMHGNVWEWCEDRYRAYSDASQKDPLATQGGGPVIRGASFATIALDTRSAARHSGFDDTRGYSLGARLVRAAPADLSVVKPQPWGTVKTSRVADEPGSAR